MRPGMVGRVQTGDQGAAPGSMEESVQAMNSLPLSFSRTPSHGTKPFPRHPGPGTQGHR